MTPDDIATWMERNLNASVIGTKHWRRINQFGLEVTLRKSVEQALATDGEAGARAAIASITTQARRMWSAQRRAERRPRSTIAEDIALFMHRYGRKRGQNGHDSNDRHYSRTVEEAVKRMDPTELDALLRGDDSM